MRDKANKYYVIVNYVNIASSYVFQRIWAVLLPELVFGYMLLLHRYISIGTSASAIAVRNSASKNRSPRTIVLIILSSVALMNYTVLDGGYDIFYVVLMLATIGMTVIVSWHIDRLLIQGTVFVVTRVVLIRAMLVLLVSGVLVVAYDQIGEGYLYVILLFLAVMAQAVYLKKKTDADALHGSTDIDEHVSWIRRNDEYGWLAAGLIGMLVNFLYLEMLSSEPQTTAVNMAVYYLVFMVAQFGSSVNNLTMRRHVKSNDTAAEHAYYFRSGIVVGSATAAMCAVLTLSGSLVMTVVWGIDMDSREIDLTLLYGLGCLFVVKYFYNDMANKIILTKRSIHIAALYGVELLSWLLVVRISHGDYTSYGYQAVLLIAITAIARRLTRVH